VKKIERESVESNEFFFRSLRKARRQVVAKKNIKHKEIKTVWGLNKIMTQLHKSSA